MAFIFSRRAYLPAESRFTNSASGTTRYLRLVASDAGPHGGPAMSPTDWLAMVQDTAQTPDILIFVHGYNTSQAALWRRHMVLKRKLVENGYKGALVSYDWPSDGDRLRYISERREAKAVSTAFLADGILMLLTRAAGYRVHILAHSMGAYLTLRALAAFGGVGRVDQVIFTAADINSAWMGSGVWGGMVMQRRCLRFTNYHNPDDKVLILSKNWFHSGAERAGLEGLPDRTPPNCRDVYCARQYQIGTAARTLARSHNWYFEDSGFYRDLSMTLAGVKAAQMPTRVATNKGGQALYA